MKKNIILSVIVGVVVLLMVSAIFSNTGFLTYFRLKTETKLLSQKLETEEKLRDSLILIKARLQNDPSYIERVAREELGFCYKDEKLLKIIPVERKE